MASSVEASPGAARQLPWIISVDDHVIEPPHVWSSRLPAKYRDVGPRYERRRVGKTRWDQGGFVTDRDDAGEEADVWCYETVVKPIRRNIAAAGLDRDEMDLNPINFDAMRKGCYDPAARLADMDLGHIDASLCFPQMSRFCGQEFYEAKDKDLALLCVQAYNDWMVEEWCGDSGGRLIPLCMVPLWDAALAAAEVGRNAARGVHAITFSENPYVLGLPSIHSGYWDPMFLACAETDTTVCMHIGSSSRMATVSADALPAVGATLASLNAVTSLTEFLFSGLLERYPTLQLAYSESQVGWIPYQLERADTVWQEHRAWNGLNGAMTNPPSYYYYRQVYGCVFRDFFGLQNLGTVGVDNVTLEADYPHTDSSWPDTASLAAQMAAGLTDEEIYKVFRGNAIRMLHLDVDRNR
jgi:predicted TIM-barrel fold metal-dependent hydrolase